MRPSATSREDSSARTVAATDPMSSSTSSASGLSNRNISVATGVSASTAPAISPATAEPEVRRTVACSSPTEATPMRACGTRMLHDDSPKTRTERAMTHSAMGGLSTVIEFAASEDPKKNAFQDADPAWAAAE